MGDSLGARHAPVKARVNHVGPVELAQPGYTLVGMTGLEAPTRRPRRPWYQYVAIAVVVTVVGAFALLVALVLFFMLIYGW
jgi:hypothetical protein